MKNPENKAQLSTAFDEALHELGNKYYLIFQLKPDLLSMGIDMLLPKVTNQEMEALDTVLKTPGDKREGQVIANFDRMYQHIKDKAQELNIPLPLLFESDSINRTALIYFNTDKEVSASLCI